MSWIRNHVRHFVVPGIFAIAEAHRKKQPNPTFWSKQDHNLVDKKYPVRNLRPARGLPNKELGLVWTALRSVGYEPYMNGITRSMVQKMDVSPAIPNRLRGEYTHSGADVIHTMVKNSFKALRRITREKTGRTLILPGRDVWLWSVMCHKMSVEHIFDARISRTVARDGEALKSIVRSWNVNKNTIIFDTGFAGTIYRCIKTVTRKDPINLMLSTRLKDRKNRSSQLFPNHKGARNKALTIEYLPKYQKTGAVRNGKPVQWLADLDEFIRTAVLTIWFWHHESPAWIDQGGKRCQVVDCLCRSCKLWKEGHHESVASEDL